MPTEIPGMVVARWQRWFSELKRRNVPRAGALYIAAVWALSQGIAQLSPAFGLPSGLTRWFVTACVIGFPFWIVFAWFYELTAHGFRRERGVDPGPAQVRQTSRRLDYWIIGVLAVAVVMLLTNQLILHRGATLRELTGTPAAAASFRPPTDTLVVLPFKNLNGDPQQAYFSDGITEELTDALGRIPALRVIAWDTASTLRDGAQSATDIGRKLDVAYLLHGSILRQGDAVRITAELVNTVTGYQLWSAHYDQPFKDIFAVQDQVSVAIAGALQVEFARSDRPADGTRNPEAHDLVLKSRALVAGRSRAAMAAARRNLEHAIALDPGYADAYAELASVLVSLSDYSTLAYGDIAPKARLLASKALTFDPRDANALVVLGGLDTNAFEFADARAKFRQALAIDPNNAGALVDYALVLPVDAALSKVRKAALLDPDGMATHMNLALLYAYRGDYAQMLGPAQATLRINPASPWGAFLLAFAYRQLHRYDAMVKVFDRVKPATMMDRLQVQAGRLAYQTLSKPSLRPQALAAAEALRMAKPDPYSQRNLIQSYLVLGERTAALRQLETLCPSFPIACSDLSLFPMFHPVSGNLRFKKLAKKYTMRGTHMTHAQRDSKRERD